MNYEKTRKYVITWIYFNANKQNGKNYFVPYMMDFKCEKFPRQKQTWWTLIKVILMVTPFLRNSFYFHVIAILIFFDFIGT